MMKSLSILAGASFSLLYVAVYPVLTGGFVFHMWPPWSPWAAAAYVLAGILIQGWFCWGVKGPIPKSRLLTQIATGAMYIAALLAGPGHLIQT